MIIKRLELIHFGKFHHKVIELQPGMNIIYGANEAGKSTIHQFIQAMLFGAERLRGKGAAQDGYSRYQPWQDGRNYEGLLTFSYGGKDYRIYRNFYKESETFKVFEDVTGEELTLPNGRLDDLIEGFNEANYKNTISIRQRESRLDTRFSASLQSYMANMSMTRSEAVDIRAALERLSSEEKQIKKQLLDGRIAGLETEMGQLRAQLAGMPSVKERIEGLKAEEALLAAKINESSRKAEALFKEEQRERMEGSRLIEQHQMLIKSQKQQKLKAQKAAELRAHYLIHQPVFKGFIGLTAAAAVLMALQLIARLDILPLKILTGIMLAAAFICLAATSFKRPKPEPVADMHGELSRLVRQIAYYTRKYGSDMMGGQNAEAMQQALKELMHKREQISRQKEKLIWQCEHGDELRARLSDIEEACSQLREENEKYKDELRAVVIARETIEALSGKIHKQFGTMLNQEVAQIFEEISGSGGSRLYIDEKLNIFMDGVKQHIPMNRLSAGTIDQLYFALRFCAAKLIFNGQPMPMIFDDTFAFYDDLRLRNILVWLMEQRRAQLLLFTCHHREADAMDDIGCDYNYISLS